MARPNKIDIRFNDHPSHLCSSVKDLRYDSDFTDVTIICENNTVVEAHKVILASFSQYFRRVLRDNSLPHRPIYLLRVKMKDMMSLLDYMYSGQVEVAMEDIDSLMSLFNELQVKGTESEENNKPDLIKQERLEDDAMPDTDEDGGREDMEPPDQGQSIPAASQSIPAVGENASQFIPAVTAVGEDAVRGGLSPSVPHHKYPLLLFHTIESMPATGQDGDIDASVHNQSPDPAGSKENREEGKIKKKRSKVDDKNGENKVKGLSREPKNKDNTSASRDKRHKSSSRDRTSTDREKPGDTSQEGSRHMRKHRGKEEKKEDRLEKKEKLKGAKETMKTKDKKRKRKDSEERDDDAKPT